MNIIGLSKIDYKRISKSNKSYIVGICIAYIYCLISVLFSNNVNFGLRFLFEVSFYLVPAIYISQKCSLYHTISVLHFLVAIHVIFLYMQRIAPNLFSIVSLIFPPHASRDLLLIDNAYAGLTGQTSTISYYMIIGISIVLYKLCRKKKIIYLIELTIYLFAILLSYRRGSFICAGTLICMYLIFGQEKSFHKIFFVAIVSVILICFNVVEITEVSNLMEKTRYQNQHDNVLSGRMIYWSVAWENFQSAPLFGKGFNSTSTILGASSVHNSYLQKLADIGICGFILFFFPFLKVFILTLNELIARNRLNSWINKYLYSFLMFCFLMQVYIFHISFSEGQFETSILFFMTFLVQLYSLKYNRDKAHSSVSY